MSDDTEKTVDTGSETPSETPATEEVAAPAETPSETPQDAGAATEPTPSETPASADVDASRTGYADKGLRAGDACICPDGRKGTVHQYDAGLICIPNQDQSE